MNKVLKAVSDSVILAIGGLAVIVLIGLLLGVPVWLLWNALIPELFGLKAINLLQAIGLATLSGLLFQSGSSSKK